jgi:hypothetical protein
MLKFVEDRGILTPRAHEYGNGEPIYLFETE